MVKVENIETWGFRHAIRGMRNPLNSWDKSDTEFSEDNSILKLGDNDLDLMRRLYKGGSEHRKYLRQIFVSMDITAPLYWISELDTYKVGTARNSCSFMHKGVSKPFEITDFSVHDERVYEILSPLPQKNYSLTYPYETDEYRIYQCANKRSYRIYRNGRIVAEPFSYVDTKGRKREFQSKECSPSKTRTGYFEIHIGGRNGERWLLHRLIATAWLINPDNLETVNHKDGNKGNNCVENLEWCSRIDNIKDGFKNGLFEGCSSLHALYKKWKNGHIVVSPIKKTQIIREYNEGISCKEIAQKYDITVNQANNLVSSRLISNENNELFYMCYIWEKIINALNTLRQEYLETKDAKLFQQIRCLLPCGYNQRFTITMNYENVVNIIKQRTGHLLEEWEDLIKILKELPYLDEIVGE